MEILLLVLISTLVSIVTSVTCVEKYIGRFRKLDAQFLKEVEETVINIINKRH